MPNSNDVCRDILDSRDVTNQKISETILAELATGDILEREFAMKLVKRLHSILNEQTDALVDRVLNTLK